MSDEKTIILVQPARVEYRVRYSRADAIAMLADNGLQPAEWNTVSDDELAVMIANAANGYTHRGLVADQLSDDSKMDYDSLDCDDWQIVTS